MGRVYDATIHVDLGSDQTSLHNPWAGGYYPAGMGYEEANTLMELFSAVDAGLGVLPWSSCPSNSYITQIPSVPGSLWSAKLPRLGGPEMFFAFVVSPRWIRPVALDEEESLSRSSSQMFHPPVGAGVSIFKDLIIETPGLIGLSGVARRGSGGVLRHYHRFCSAWAGERTGSAGVDSR